MKLATTITMSALLCGCATTGPGSTSSTSPPAVVKPAYCAFESPPSVGLCIGNCNAQAGDMSDPQSHSKLHLCIHECNVQHAAWSPRPECR